MLWRGLFLLALTACCPRSPLTPNGRDQVLAYRTEFPALADGLEAEIEVPEAISEPHDKLALCPPRSRSWDFAGTALEAENGRSLEVLSSEHLAWGYRLRVRCRAGAGASDGLAVKVVADGEPRYADVFPIACEKPEEASFVVKPAGAPEVFLVGSKFALEPVLSGPDGERLSGAGFRADDAGVLKIEEERERSYLDATAMKPGKRPKLHAGATLVEAPIDVVGPEAIAALELTVTPLNPGDASRNVVAVPKDRQGRAVGTQACAWTTPGAMSRFVPNSGAFCATYVEPGAGATTVCAAIGGVTGCAAL